MQYGDLKNDSTCSMILSPNVSKQGTEENLDLPFQLDRGYIV